MAPDPVEIDRKASELQQRYWSLDADELRALLERFPDGLTWPERLRLHHLACLELLGDQPVDADELAPSSERAVELVQRTSRLLIAEESPYRPRLAFVYGGAGEVNRREDPDLQGTLYNASLTHLGAVEVIRTDAAVNPVEVAFVSLDELNVLDFPRPPARLCVAEIGYEDRRSEMVLVPLLYGVSWRSSLASDTDISMTRFVCHVEIADVAEATAARVRTHLGVGVGHQDLAIAIEGGQTLLGLGSLRQIEFPLVMWDPRFDERCRRRGIDPDEIRRLEGRGTGELN
jgi:hypothetical protein